MYCVSCGRGRGRRGLGEGDLVMFTCLFFFVARIDVASSAFSRRHGLPDVCLMQYVCPHTDTVKVCLIYCIYAGIYVIVLSTPPYCLICITDII